MHDISLITTIAFGFTAALFFGIIAKRIGLSPIVGYLIAGIAIGPHTPGFVGDAGLAKQLAEIGVMLLMFGVGLHFHFTELMAVRSIAVPGAIGQSVAATACGLGVALALGWEWNGGIVLGVAISVASTVVLLRALMDRGIVETAEGRVAIGWLVVEDIITVLVLVLLPALAAGNATAGSGERNVLLSAGVAVLKLVALAAIMAVVGVRVVPWLMLRVAALRSRELFTLTVLVMAMAVATFGYFVFGASMALGAFIGGMVVGQSKLSHQAAADALPMRDAFAVLFFVSIGMLFDWRSLLHEWPLILGMLLVVVVVKPLIALLIVAGLRHSFKTGMVVAAGLGQIGEFSFIVAEAARPLGLMSDTGHHALVACAIVSISMNPWLFRATAAFERWVGTKPALQTWIDRRSGRFGQTRNLALSTRPATTDKPLAIVVGYGPVGRSVSRRLEEFGLEPHLIDMNVETIVTLQSEGKHALYGDAAKADILIAAGVKQATYLVITLPDPGAGQTIVTVARRLNPNVRILMRARYLAQGELLMESGADAVCYDEAEVATALAVLLRAHLQGDGYIKPPAGDQPVAM
jgi:monovalent cation:H+ antiporter-2, CPA2 family